MSAKNVTLTTGSDLATAVLEMLEDYELVFIGRQPTEPQLITLCQQHNLLTILVRYNKIMVVVVDAASALKVIAKHDSSIDVIGIEVVTTRGIMVRAATGTNVAAVSEYTWALVLACARSVTPLDRRLRGRHWDKSTHKSLELEDKTPEPVGLGAIGSHVMKTTVAFDVKVPAYDPYTKTIPPEYERVDELKDLLMQADILSLHCPLTQHNRGMINAATLAQYKPGVILMNTACGGLINDVASVTALKAEISRWAAPNSFHSEPLITPYIWQAIDNAILFPHVGGVSDASYVKMGTAVIASILQVLQESVQTEATF